MARMITSDGPRQKHFIKEWREFRDLTQEQVADAIGTTKVSISRIERGLQPYTQESLESLAVALSCAPADLISRRPDEEPEVSLFDLDIGEKRQVKAYLDGIRAAKQGGNEPSRVGSVKPRKTG